MAQPIVLCAEIMPVTAAIPLSSAVPDWRQALVSHLRSLGDRSRLSRFRTMVSDFWISRYAEKIEPIEVLCIREKGEVVGVAELHQMNDSMIEVALSVSDCEQGHGLGRVLMDEAVACARDLGAREVILGFSYDNNALRRLTLRHNARLEREGSEVEAHIAV